MISLGNRFFAVIISSGNSDRNHSEFTVGPNPMTGIFIRGTEDTDTHKKLATQRQVLLTRAEAHQKSPETEGNKEGSSLRVPGGRVPLLTP